METKNCNFERERCIGRGTFGKVYLCFDKKERQKKFAMKIIDLEGLSEDERNSAEKEALLLTTLQHKYMLYALSYLHQKKVLHRDIKPQNIFLTGKEMTIKLGDLGLAKVLESSMQKASTFCGTQYYMSPEIVSGRPYNSKSDIWAMGVCIYEMTTLRRPFDARLEYHLYLKIAYDQLPPIPKDKYSPRLIKVIERMLCRDADSRPSATELLQDVLFKNPQTSLVCERDALDFEKKICKKSTDSCNVKVEKIPSHEISKFLDGLQRSGDFKQTGNEDGIKRIYCD
uniref:non-specific serine/threonine protein kinase n=1 Tax=Magallana gigas TaxID=29159 RepID=K1QBM5_MAGGI